MSFLIASITPVIIFLFLIYKRDQIKEPPAILAKCFFGGFLSIIITLILVILIQLIIPEFSSPFLKSFYEAFLTAGLPEEFSKFLILYWIVWKSKDFDQYYDGIIYAVFVSLGFALIENILYVFKGGMSVALMRSVLAVPGHGFFAVIMGYYLSLAKFHTGNQKNNLLLKSLFIPVLFHGLYDFTLMYAGNSKDNPLLIIGLMISFTIIVIKLWRVGLNRIKRHHQTDIETIPVVES